MTARWLAGGPDPADGDWQVIVIGDDDKASPWRTFDDELTACASAKHLVEGGKCRAAVVYRTVGCYIRNDSV